MNETGTERMAEELATHIFSDPRICGGRPRIDGYRITVHNVAARLTQGITAEEIAAGYCLTLGQVHAALAYYFDHQDEIDRELADDEAEIRRLAQADMSPGAQRVRRALAEQRRHLAGG